MSYLENRDEIVITEIKVLNAGIGESINVYIMNGYQFEALQDSGGLIWNYIKRWQDTVWLAGWSIDIIEAGNYYIVLYNKNLFSELTVIVDVSVRHYYPPVKEDNFFLGWLLFIILPAIAVVIIVAVLVRKRKKKIPREVVIVPEIIYCQKCGIEVIDKTRKFCSNCGTKII